jgi:CHAT domain-containing protein
MSRCPDSARIAAYLDDRLFEEERRVLEEHFATCESCGRELADSIACLAELRSEEENAAPAPRRLAWLRYSLGDNHRRSAAIAASLAVVLGAGGWLLYGRLAAPTRGDASELHAGFVERRPVVPRFVGAEWKPRPNDRARGLTTAPSLEPGAWRYQKMVDEARLTAGDSPNGAQLQRLGAAYLLAGNADQGLQTLERAMAALPKDAHALSDLGAAYLARGLEHDDGNDIAQALETIDRALDADAGLLEARFNRALALEEMPLPGEAAKAWKAYLELDARSKWAQEAQNQLDQLARVRAEAPSAAELRVEISTATADEAALESLVRAHRQEAREAFTLDLLPAWGRAVVGGDGREASERLEAARRVATEWKRQTDDGSLLRQVDEIAEAVDRAGFARGQQTLGAGLEALEALQVERAAASFATARRELPPSSAAQAWAELSALACELYRGGAQTALLSDFASLASRAEGDEPLRAHLAWLQGLTHLRRGEPQALGQFAESLAAFERLGEEDHAMWLHNQLAQASALFGDLPRAWLHRRQMLNRLPQLSHRERRFPLLLEPAISAAYLEDRPGVASAFLGELSNGGVRWAPRQTAELELWRSRVELKLGAREEARSSLRAATAWLWQVEDGAVRKRLAADVQAAKGMAAEAGRSALDSLSAAIDRMRTEAPDFRLAGLLLERARTYRRLNDDHSAAADLREGIALLLREHADDPMRGLLSRQLSGGDALFEELVGLELAAGDSDRAFAVADQARSRAVYLAAGRNERSNNLLSAENEVSTLRALREQLEPGTAVLYFCLLKKEAFLWRVDSAAATVVRLDASPAELVAWSARLRTDLAAGVWTPHTRKAASLLYRGLIGPAHFGAQVQKLVVVPDARLDQLPFAALVDPTSGRFLIEQASLEVAPSALTFLAARTRARQLGNGTPSVLALGDPRPDEELYPRLQPLRGAADEARQVALLYPRHELLLGERATRAALLKRAGTYDVLHFAGHAVVNPVDPARSSMALSPEPGSGEPGALYAYEVSAARFERTRLVVLAGCGTASGPVDGGTGSLSLARAFLAAHVPTVVASLWPVVDQRTAPVMTALHTRLSRGDDPADALRAVQIALLRSPDAELQSPSTWAAFRVFGG